MLPPRNLEPHISSLSSGFLFSAVMAIQRKDLCGHWYLLLGYFAWVLELQLCMEFKTYGILRYAHMGHFKFIPHSTMKVISLFKQSPEYINYAALVIGGSFLIEGISVCIVYVWTFGIFSLFIIVISLLMIKYVFRCIIACCYKCCEERCSCWENDDMGLCLAWPWPNICCCYDRGGYVLNYISYLAFLFFSAETNDFRR